MINITKIYLITNIDNDPNKVYIGKTRSSRKIRHVYTYGKQITYDYIDEIDSLNHKDWEPLETYWIEQLRQWGFEVMNKRKKGGSGPEYQTEETKSKISCSSKGKILSEETKLRISKSKTGYKHPKEWGIKQSILKKGKPNLKLKGQKYNVRHVLQYDLDKNFIKEFGSYMEAKKLTGIDPQHCLIGKTKTAGKFRWEYQK